MLGLGAGSRFATYERTGIMVVDFDQTTKIFPSLHMTAMVDDVNLEFEGGSDVALAAEFVEAAKHTAGQLSDLRLPLAGEKSSTLGSSHRLATMVARSLGDGRSTGTTSHDLG